MPPRAVQPITINAGCRARALPDGRREDAPRPPPQVGGERFTTMPATLLESGSDYFRELLEDPDSGDGDLFIDRDPEAFKYVLSFLRTGALVVPESAAHVLKLILLDAEFYGLEKIVTYVTDKCSENLLPRDAEADCADRRGTPRPTLVEESFPRR